MASSSSTRQKAIFYMVLLTVQFGCQPLLTHKYTSPKICRSSVLFVQEALKLCLALFMLVSTGDFSSATQGWTVLSWIQVAFVPAALYTLQNSLALLAYQNLDGVTFNVLNQTKTLSAALCCYWLMGKKQSRVQILSLLLLLLSALVLERIVSIDFLTCCFPFGGEVSSLGRAISDSDGSSTNHANIVNPTIHTTHFTHGVAPVLGASFLSGLAGAISQKNLQSSSSSSSKSSSKSSKSGGGGGGRNPYLFSAELCVASLVVLSISFFWSDDGKQITSQGFFYEWTPWTMIPILTNAMGGIVVGLVTKYAGSVRKGFALIFGMLFTGIIQSILVVDVMESGSGSSGSSGSHPSMSKEQMVGGMLAALSLWLHSTHPHPIQKTTMVGSTTGAGQDSTKKTQ